MAALVLTAAALLFWLQPVLSAFLIQGGSFRKHVNPRGRAVDGKRPTQLAASISAPNEERDTLESSFPSGCTIELTEPKTGCHVVLLGCFHGSQSSALDVTTCLSQEPPVNGSTVVALELCATRFADLRRELQQERSGEQFAEDGSSDQVWTGKTSSPWLSRWMKMVRKTIQQRGLSTGLAAALLGGVSGIQTSTSGLEPGLEFRTALLHVNKESNRTDIVLADQSVDETLDKIGQLPTLSILMWKDFLGSGLSWRDTFGIEARALQQAVGISTENQRNVVTLSEFVTRSKYAMRDMARLVIPPFVALQLSLLAVNSGFDWLHEQPEWISTATAAANLLEVQEATSDVFSATDTAVATLALWLTNCCVLALGYISAALPAVRVILRERDDILAEGIEQACRVATQQGQQPGRVVAVLGLLHVNGVAERLLTQQQHVKRLNAP